MSGQVKCLFALDMLNVPLWNKSFLPVAATKKDAPEQGILLSIIFEIYFTPPTIKLRFKVRQPAASFSISKPKRLEWESKWLDIVHLGLTRPQVSPSAASLIRGIRFAQVVPPMFGAFASPRRLNRQ